MINSNLNKEKQLGMPIGTASNRLKKSIIFNLLKKANENFCFQCGKEIEIEKELSIEHKIPYLNSKNPKELFFDLENIAFSHLSCNSKASRKKIIEHGASGYKKRNCRCEICVNAHKEQEIRFKHNRKIKNSLIKKIKK